MSVRSNASAKIISRTPLASVINVCLTDQDTVGTTTWSRNSSSLRLTRFWTTLNGATLQRPSCDRWAGRIKKASTNDTARTKAAM